MEQIKGCTRPVVSSSIFGWSVPHKSYLEPRDTQSKSLFLFSGVSYCKIALCLIFHSPGISSQAYFIFLRPFSQLGVDEAMHLPSTVDPPGSPWLLSRHFWSGSSTVYKPLTTAILKFEESIPRIPTKGFFITATSLGIFRGKKSFRHFWEIQLRNF